MIRLVFSLMIAVPTAAQADCFLIRDLDLKRSCQALDKLEDGDVGMARSYAAQVRDRDQQKRIRAIISAETGDAGMARSHCNAIQDRDEKHHCQARINR